MEAIRDAADREDCVCSVRRVLTTHMAPDQAIATMGVEFGDNLKIRPEPRRG